MDRGVWTGDVRREGMDREVLTGWHGWGCGPGVWRGGGVISMQFWK